jgi:hypothetical protein
LYERERERAMQTERTARHTESDNDCVPFDVMRMKDAEPLETAVPALGASTMSTNAPFTVTVPQVRAVFPKQLICALALRTTVEYDALLEMPPFHTQSLPNFFPRPPHVLEIGPVEFPDVVFVASTLSTTVGAIAHVVELKMGVAVPMIRGMGAALTDTDTRANEDRAVT